MPKHPTKESSFTSKPKRQKSSKDQPLIHQFFSSPSNRRTELSIPNVSPTVGSSSWSSKGRLAQVAIPIIDVDALEDESDKGSFLTKAAFNTSTGSNNQSPSSTEDQRPMVAKLSKTSVPLVYGDLTYDPTIQQSADKPWPSASLPYSFLAHTLSTLTQTRSRITITRVLTNCFHLIIRHDPQSLLSALYLLSNTLAPPYHSLELGLGPSIITRSIQNVSGLTSTALKRLYNSTGDIGDVAFAAKSNLRTLLPHPPLLVNFVYNSLLKIAHSKGQGMSKEKKKIVEKLLLAATGEEVRFLVRTLSQNLRVGAVRTTLLTALARAMVLVHMPLPPQALSYVSTSRIDDADERAVSHRLHQLDAQFEQAESLIKRIYVQHPNYEDIILAFLEGGLNGLQERVRLTIGIPLHPTLGSPTRSLEDVYEISQNRPFMAEFKYDGQRAQIHGSITEGKVIVSIFSRHLEDMTTKYPDIVHLVQAYFHDHPETLSFILDAEIVPINQDGEVKSFQDLSNRARKDVELADIRVYVSVFAFDLMYLNGEVLLGRTFRERRDLLLSRFPQYSSPDKRLARFEHVKSCSSTEGRGAIDAFWEEAIESRCEGLMIKLLDNEPSTNAAIKTRRKQLPATYEPDKRTSAWLKLKKDYVTGLGDSLDLIPIGAWHGNGRKAGWWSPILLGLWQPASGRIVAVCKCMSGFTDKFYKELAERYQVSEKSDICSPKPLWECDTGGLVPEVYFKPLEVWEVRCADITLSPVSVAAKGLVSLSRGLSLRFPRFIRTREDKSIELASTPEFLVKLWKEQEKGGVAQGGNDEGELVDATDASEYGSAASSSED